jgi:hypothetical protein
MPELPHWMGSWLAARAIIGVPRIDAVTLQSADHFRSAAAARSAGPLEYPVLPATCQLTGGGLLGPVGVGQQQLPSQGYHGVGIHVANRGPRRYAQEKTELRSVQVSNPDHP